MENITNQLTDAIGATVPDIIAALAILIVGWIIALIAASVVRRVLRRTSVDDRIAARIMGEERAGQANVERATSKVVFWLIMVFVFVATFQALGLTLITQPLNNLLNELFAFLPRLLGAGILVVIAWGLASLLRILVSRGLEVAKLDERVSRKADAGEGPRERRVPVARTLGDAVYWLVFLLFLPAILGALALEGLLTPVQGMLDRFLTFLPNVASAALIALIGWFVARVVQRIVSNLLSAAGTDRLSDRVGLSKALGSQKLSRLVGLVVYILILVPVLIAALDALKLEAVSTPASNMLNMFLEAIPAIFGAALVVGLSYVVGRLVAGLVGNLLAGIGFDRILLRLKLTRAESQDPLWTPSAIVGHVVLVVIMLFAATEAFALLGFEALSGLVSQFLFFAGHVAMGLAIFGLGLYLADVVARVIRASGVMQAGLLALVARVSVLLLAGAMALQQMGFANEIVVIGFGVIVGSVAVALAVAFGVGGRHIAARELENWVNSWKSD